jgi:hypothetical protein
MTRRVPFYGSLAAIMTMKFSHSFGLSLVSIRVAVSTSELFSGANDH